MNLPTKIDSFSGDWSFLSNFYPCIVLLDGVKYGSVEHAYQAAKTLDLEKRVIFSLDFNPDLHPGQAKRIGQKLALRSDWELVKTEIMCELLLQKFAPTVLRRKLLSTFSAELVEGNWWHDTFWGVCMGAQNGHQCHTGPHEPIGQNILGQSLMKTRVHFGGLTMQPQRTPGDQPCGLL